MSLDKLVTIIIPTYNSQTIISRVIDSVIYQTYDNWNLIIVDDGSTDKTRDLIYNYISLDDRITYIFIDKSGAAAARNVGLDLARGEYVVFADADDELEPDSLNIRVKLVSECDFGIANYIKIPSDDIRHIMDGEWTKDQTIKRIVRAGDWGYQGYLWNKIFALDIIKKYNIRFAEGIVYNEDRLFCYTYAQYINKTVLSNLVVYKYINSDNSIMNKLKKVDDSNFDSVITEFLAFEEMKRINSKYTRIINIEEFYRAVYLNDLIDDKAIKLHREFNKIINKIGFQIVFSRELFIRYRFDVFKLILKTKLAR